MIRSLVIACRVDTAKSAHNCKANKKHRLERGHVRLEVKSSKHKQGRNYYCTDCAQAMIAKSIERLNALREMRPEEAEEDSE